MKRTKIKEILKNKDLIGNEVAIAGWLRTVRNQKTFSFMEVNDGSFFSGLQVIVDQSLPGYEEIVEQAVTGASVYVTGKLVESPGKGQSFEIKASSIKVFGTADPETYPLQKKRHSFEFLRTIAHLRPRTNTFGAVARVRSALAQATHQFFQEKGFLNVHTPIITGSDCEGAGEMFRLTVGEEEFFGKRAYLTVSGQLEGETYACGLSDIYTFGPTFRAENSNTSRHLSEFWMIEPEAAFCDLDGIIDLSENYLKYLVRYALDNCERDLEFFNSFVEKGLLDKLSQVVETPFERLSYTEAITILEKSGKKFEFPVSWGLDLQSEHERYLAEEHFKKPVVLTDYPEKIKAFYMRANDDGKTVAAMDMLLPKIGELMGGSQREDRYDLLEKKIASMGLDPKEYWWYLELRKYGSVPHSGFGLGFERLVQFVTGMENIRDVIPFPRYPGHVEF